MTVACLLQTYILYVKLEKTGGLLQHHDIADNLKNIPEDPRFEQLLLPRGARLGVGITIAPVSIVTIAVQTSSVTK